eukprot:5714155-Amphidinium_carterae.1
MLNLDEVVLAVSQEPLQLQGPTYCEELSLVEQVATFARASAVLAVHGACLTNTLYMPPGSMVIDLVPVQNFIGHGITMPLQCGITYYWAIASN